MSLWVTIAGVVLVVSNLITFWIARRAGIIEGFLNHMTPPVRKILEAAQINIEWHRNRIAEEQRRKHDKPAQRREAPGYGEQHSPYLTF